MTSSAHTLSKDLAALLKDAMERPGVADVMQIYGQYESILAQTDAYLAVMTDEPIFSVTDSSSQ